MDFPLRYARRNILIAPGGEAAALYRAEAVSYPFAPLAEKWGLLRRLERFGHLVGADFSIWRVGRAYPAERYAADLAATVDPHHGDPEAWRSYLEGHEARLGELESSLPQVYVAVSLGERAAGHLRSLGRARRRVEEIAGVGAPRPLSRSELQELAAAERRCFERLSGLLGLRRASTHELQWLLRRAACRGVAEPLLEKNWEPEALVAREEEGAGGYEPLGHDLWRLCNAPMSEDPGEPPSLALEAEEGCSYQAFLCAGSLAEEATFPGPAELLFAPFEDAGFPADAVLHARWIGNREALGQVRKRIIDAEHGYREQAEGAQAGPGWQAEEDRELAREYEAILSSSAHPPMLRACLGVAVGAADRFELERRVEALRERFGEVRLHRPRGLQHRLFLRAPAARRRRLTLRLPPADDGRAARRDGACGERPARLATPAPTSGTRPPAPGARFAMTRPRRRAQPAPRRCCSPARSARARRWPHRRSPTAPSAAARSSSTSTPSPTTTWRAIPELEGRVEVVELSGDERHRGKLDPLAVGLPELREELASSYLLELLRDPPPAWENAIDRAVRDAVRAGERSLMCVVERLAASDAPAAREAGEALEVLADFGLARLGFAPLEEAA